MEDINYIAEKFLEEHVACEAHTLMTERIVNGMLQVILMRAERPQYFCGFKPSGTIVWAYDYKLAKSINYADVEQWVEALIRRGVFVLPIWNGVKLPEQGRGY